LKKKPRDPNTRLLHTDRILTILLIGLSLATLLLTIFAYMLHHNTEAQARTVVFNGLIYLHLLIMIVLGWHSIKKGNIFLIFTIVLIAILQLIITYVPLFQQIFHLEI